jgi:hypothetical protein
VKALRKLRNRCTSAAKAPQNRSAVAAKSLRIHFVIAAKSPRNRFADISALYSNIYDFRRRTFLVFFKAAQTILKGCFTNFKVGNKLFNCVKNLDIWHFSLLNVLAAFKGA